MPLEMVFRLIVEMKPRSLERREMGSFSVITEGGILAVMEKSEGERMDRRSDLEMLREEKGI